MTRPYQTRGSRTAVTRLTHSRTSGKRSGEWRRVRAAFLKDHPTCEACGGTDFLEVHHVQCFRDHPDRELDPTNFASMCEKPGRDCHFVFGHAYNWKRVNPTVRADAARWLRHLKALQQNDHPRKTRTAKSA